MHVFHKKGLQEKCHKCTINHIRVNLVANISTLVESPFVLYAVRRRSSFAGEKSVAHMVVGRSGQLHDAS